MDGNIEHELCNNCKKEIPQPNYIMHTMHCARNITLCKKCNEPIPKSQFSEHEKSCKLTKSKPPSPPPIALEKSSYFQTRKAVEDKKTEARRERYMKRMDKLVDSGYSMKNCSQITSSTASPTPYSGSLRENSYGHSPQLSNETGASRSRETGFNFPLTSNYPENKKEPLIKPTRFTPELQPQPVAKSEIKSSGMLACKYCDLELPKLDLEDHENYCGSRTDKCMECGELVMFKDKQAHMASNHSSAVRRNNIGRSSRPIWDSDSQRSETASGESSSRRPPVRPLGTFDYDPMPYLPSAYQAPTAGGVKKKEGESYKEISRRLDSGPAPQPPYRRRNPPTELVIPCEFCDVPVPHEDLIEHETGCRPDLARYTPRNRNRFSPERDDHLTASSSPDVELPCEFCGDMIPASQLYSHQIRCN